jgi:hypothetical protein
VVPAEPTAGTYTYDGVPDGAEVLAVYHTHPVEGGLYFSRKDASQVMKREGTPMYLRNEIGDVRILNRTNIDPQRLGESICGGRGEAACLSRHPDATSPVQIINSTRK